MGDGLSDFEAEVRPVGAGLRAHMRGRTWHDDPDCPPFAELRHLLVRHWGFDGQVHAGELVVASSVVRDLCSIFGALFDMRYPIERLQRADAFDGDDARAMAANNSSAFNFRRIAGSASLSHHALGIAVDLNPRQNPMCFGVDAGVDLDRQVHPAGANPERDPGVPGVITAEGPVVALFRRYGWYWGGDWEDVRDYHHFSARPRHFTGVAPSADPSAARPAP